MRSTVMTVFKLLGGRLLCQLHARAARHAEVPDTWFHAPSLQHEQFRKGAHPNTKQPAHCSQHTILTAAWAI